VGARIVKGAKHPRHNVYGESLPSDSRENGRVEVIPRKGEFWGAAG